MKWILIVVGGILFLYLADKLLNLRDFIMCCLSASHRRYKRNKAANQTLKRF